MSGTLVSPALANAIVASSILVSVLVSCFCTTTGARVISAREEGQALSALADDVVSGTYSSLLENWSNTKHDVNISTPYSYSPDCGLALESVYNDETTKKVMDKIQKDLKVEGEGLEVECQAHIFPCTTAFGKGTCCPVNGIGLWESHIQDLQALQNAGSRVVAGSVATFSQIMTVNVQGPNTLLTVSSSFLMPFFAPEACTNLDDSKAIADEASQRCVAATISGADVKACTMIW